MQNRRPVAQVNLDWAKNQLKNSTRKSNGDRTEYYELPEAGDLVIRVLPPDQQGRLGKVVGTHWNIQGNQIDVKGARSPCLRTNHPDIDGVRCPICEALDRLSREGVSEEFLSSYNLSTASYIKALIVRGSTRNNKQYDPKKPILFLTRGTYSLEWIYNQLSDPDIGNFIDPYSGTAIKFSRERKTDTWSRSVLPGNWTPIAPTEEEVNKILEEADKIDLYSMWKYPVGEELDNISKAGETLYKVIKERWKKANSVTAPFNGNSNVKSVAPTSTSKDPVDNPTTSSYSSQVEKSPEEIVESAKEKVNNMIPVNAPACFGDTKEYGDLKQSCLECMHQSYCGDVCMSKS